MGVMITELVVHRVYRRNLPNLVMRKRKSDLPNADSAVRRSYGLPAHGRINYLTLHPSSGLKQLGQGISGIATCFMDCYAVCRRSLRSLEQVSGAAYPRWTSVQHMGIDHGGFHIAVAE